LSRRLLLIREAGLQDQVTVFGFRPCALTPFLLGLHPLKPTNTSALVVDLHVAQGALIPPPEIFSLAPRGTSGERARGEGYSIKSASSPQPSPPVGEERE